MRQEHNETRLPDPLGLSAWDELINDALSRVREVSELRLPQNEGIGVRHGVAQLESQDAVFTEGAVANSVWRLVGVEVGQRVVGGHVLSLVMENMVPLRKRASLDVLAYTR